MARLSDIIRGGKPAPPEDEQRAEAQPPSTQPKGSTDPSNQQGQSASPESPEVKLVDFPVLSQIHNEVGVVASVVDKINRISSFIESVAGGKVVPLEQPTVQEVPAAATSVAVPPPSPQSPHPPPQPAPPSVETAAPSAEASEEEVEALHNHLLAFVQEAMTAAQEDRPFGIDQGFVLISRSVDLPGARDILYRRAIYTRETEGDHGFASAVILHSVNVAIYTIKIGEGLNYNREQLIDLGVSALLHDVGMVTLPEDIFTKGELTKEDIDTLRQHPLKGRQILTDLGEQFRWLADVAYQEHEREDGSGYPEGLSGGDIHEYAKIVSVADTYAGLTRSRPERRGLLPFEAVKEILQNHKPKFDTQIVRVLLRKLSAFPIGSLVKLNSGAIGKVIETDEANQLRPVIQIYYDAQGHKVDDERIIQLGEYPVLHVTDATEEDTSPEEEADAVEEDDSGSSVILNTLFWVFLVLLLAAGILFLEWAQKRYSKERQEVRQPASALVEPELHAKNPARTSSTPKPVITLQSKPEPPIKPSINSDSDLFTIHVSSHKVRVSAENEAGKYRRLGFPVRLMRKDIQNRGQFYRVLVGEFSAKPEASRVASVLKADKIAGYAAVLSMNEHPR